VVPDFNMFYENMRFIEARVCMTKENVPWEEKAERAWWRGKLTGEVYDDD
jgi:hypothetical protein